MTVTCTGCGSVHDGRGSVSVEQVEPVPEAPWQATRWHCGWFEFAHHYDDAHGAADDHRCRRCPTCGHDGGVAG